MLFVEGGNSVTKIHGNSCNDSLMRSRKPASGLTSAAVQRYEHIPSPCLRREPVVSRMSIRSYDPSKNARTSPLLFLKLYCFSRAYQRQSNESGTLPSLPTVFPVTSASLLGTGKTDQQSDVCAFFPQRRKRDKHSILSRASIERGSHDGWGYSSVGFSSR